MTTDAPWRSPSSSMGSPALMPMRRRLGTAEWEDTATAGARVHERAEGGAREGGDMLGTGCGQGRGVSKNVAQSATWYRRAGTQNQQAARLACGRLHRAGHAPGPGNELRAREWCG